MVFLYIRINIKVNNQISSNEEENDDHISKVGNITLLMKNEKNNNNDSIKQDRGN
jgi:hypothetical protein